MVGLKLFRLGTILLLLACSDEGHEVEPGEAILPDDSNIVQSGSGTLSFWIKSNDNEGFFIDVSVGGKNQRVNERYWGSTPTCGTEGTISFDLPAGTHEWTGTDSNGISRGGFAEVVRNGCRIIKLNK